MISVFLIGFDKEVRSPDVAGDERGLHLGLFCFTFWI